MYGTLEVRFFTDWKAWRSPRIFDYKNPKNIHKISTTFFDNKNESYSINLPKQQSRIIQFSKPKINQILTLHK